MTITNIKEMKVTLRINRETFHDKPRVYCIIVEDDLSSDLVDLLKEEKQEDAFRVDLCL